MALFVIGTRWLVATPDFAGLILNALALGFIIDALLLFMHIKRRKNSGRQVFMAASNREGSTNVRRILIGLTWTFCEDLFQGQIAVLCIGNSRYQCR